MIWAAFHLRSRRPYVAVGVLAYLLTLSIVSNFAFSVGTLMSERFLFMPSFGFALAIVALLARFKKGWWVVVGIIPVFCFLTVARNPVWKDNFTLFTTDVQHQPNSAKLLNAAAGARLDRYQQLEEAGRENQEHLLTTALEHLNRALRIHPRYGNAYLLRGNAYFLAGDYSRAVTEYESALAYGVPIKTVNRNLALALQQSGRVAGEERQDLVSARALLERSLSLAPDNYETLRLLGIAYGMGGNAQRAYDYFLRALEVEPENEGAKQNLEIARQQLRGSSQQ